MWKTKRKNWMTISALMLLVIFYWHQWLMGLSSVFVLAFAYLIHIAFIIRYLIKQRSGFGLMLIGIWTCIFISYFNVENIQFLIFKTRRPALEKAVEEVKNGHRGNFDYHGNAIVKIEGRAFTAIQRNSEQNGSQGMEFIFEPSIAMHHAGYLWCSKADQIKQLTEKRWIHVTHLEDAWYLISD